MDKEFLLVLGTPRSGTTLLTAMIGCHDDVAMLNEDFGAAARKLVGKRIVGNKLCVPNQIELSKRGGMCLRKLQRHGFFKAHPESSLSIEDYMEWDTIKLIGIIRDGTAVIKSIMRRGRQPYKVAAYRWCRGIEILHDLNGRYSGSILNISFEQLISNPACTMQVVANYLHVKYDPKMLDGYACTPIYNYDKIDSTKITKYDNEFQLESRYPEIFRQYQSLLHRAGEDARVSVGFISS